MKTSVTRNPNGTPESTCVGSHTFVRTIIKYSWQIASMTTRLAVARTQSEGAKPHGGVSDPSPLTADVQCRGGASCGADCQLVQTNHQVGSVSSGHATGAEQPVQ